MNSQTFAPPFVEGDFSVTCSELPLIAPSWAVVCFQECRILTPLFGKWRSTITEHLKNIFAEGELEEELVCRKFRHTTQHGAMEGKTQEKKLMYYYAVMIYFE